jgi:hypothetical protein
MGDQLGVVKAVLMNENATAVGRSSGLVETMGLSRRPKCKVAREGHFRNDQNPDPFRLGDTCAPRRFLFALRQRPSVVMVQDVFFLLGRPSLSQGHEGGYFGACGHLNLEIEKKETYDKPSRFARSAPSGKY